MAHFRGEVDGARSTASRLGHKNTGLSTTAQTWSGAIRVRVWWDESARVDRFEVDQIAYHGSGIEQRHLHRHQRLASGIVGEAAEHAHPNHEENAR